jgi:hypothetical protein
VVLKNPEKFEQKITTNLLKLDRADYRRVLEIIFTSGGLKNSLAWLVKTILKTLYTYLLK